MVRHAGLLFMALVVAGAPAMLTACELMCAVRSSRPAADSSVSNAQACHGSRPSGGPVVDAGGQTCSHEKEFPAAASPVAPVPVPAVIGLTASMLAWRGDALHRRHAVVASPPGHARLSIPLRV
jgi:hypothetical protein